MKHNVLKIDVAVLIAMYINTCKHVVLFETFLLLHIYVFKNVFTFNTL